jgi:hypothetical protein
MQIGRDTILDSGLQLAVRNFGRGCELAAC